MKALIITLLVVLVTMAPGKTHAQPNSSVAQVIADLSNEHETIITADAAKADVARLSRKQASVLSPQDAHREKPIVVDYRPEVEGKHTLATPLFAHPTEVSPCPDPLDPLIVVECIDLVADPLNDPIEAADDVKCSGTCIGMGCIPVLIDDDTGLEEFTVDEPGFTTNADQIVDGINAGATEWWIQVTRHTFLQTNPEVEGGQKAEWRGTLTFTVDGTNIHAQTASDELIGDPTDLEKTRIDHVEQCYRIGRPVEPSLISLTYVSAAKATCVEDQTNTAKVQYNQIDFTTSPDHPQLCWY